LFLPVYYAGIELLAIFPVLTTTDALRLREWALAVSFLVLVVAGIVGASALGTTLGADVYGAIVRALNDDSLSVFLVVGLPYVLLIFASLTVFLFSWFAGWTALLVALAARIRTRAPVVPVAAG
jgi:hypothetical protein